MVEFPSDKFEYFSDEERQISEAQRLLIENRVLRVMIPVYDMKNLHDILTAYINIMEIEDGQHVTDEANNLRREMRQSIPGDISDFGEDSPELLQKVSLNISYKDVRIIDRALATYPTGSEFVQRPDVAVSNEIWIDFRRFELMRSFGVLTKEFEAAAMEVGLDEVDTF